MKIFISGVAGFLGSHLADALLKEGYEVVGNDNLIGGDLENVPVGVQFYNVDCNNIEALKILFKDVDIIYHCAATPHEGLSVFSPYKNLMNGYSAYTAMISAAISSRVRRFVACSSMARYGKGVPDRDGNFVPFTEDMKTQPEDPYAIGKVAGEDLLKLMSKVHGMEYVIAVPHNIIGIRQRYVDPHRNVASIMINLMLQGRQPFIYGDGTQMRCFSYYTDDIDPLVKLGFNDNCLGEVINIGPDDEFVTINELARLIAEIINFDLKAIYVPARPREVKFANC